MKIFKDLDWNGITLIVTTKCNLKCSYCYERGTPHEVLNFEDGIKIIDWFCSVSKAKEQCITFFGGEPLTEASLIINLVESSNLREETGFKSQNINNYVASEIFSSPDIVNVVNSLKLSSKIESTLDSLNTSFLEESDGFDFCPKI